MGRTETMNTRTTKTARTIINTRLSMLLCAVVNGSRMSSSGTVTARMYPGTATGVKATYHVSPPGPIPPRNMHARTHNKNKTWRSHK